MSQVTQVSSHDRLHRALGDSRGQPAAAGALARSGSQQVSAQAAPLIDRVAWPHVVGGRAEALGVEAGAHDVSGRGGPSLDRGQVGGAVREDGRVRLLDLGPRDEGRDTVGGVALAVVHVGGRGARRVATGGRGRLRH